MTGDESGLIKKVLDSNYLNEGDYTEAFEKEIAGLTGAGFSVAVTSGTAAIYLSLKALNIGYGDEVIVPDLTFIATANAVEMTGAKPVLADIDPATLNISPEAVRQAVTARTKAVIPVHVSGRAANMPAIMEIAESHGIEVVEDAAEAFMSKAYGKNLGTIGKAGCLSFSPNKTITTGQGGMILTGDETLKSRLLELKDQGRPVRGTGGDDVHPAIGYNFKLTNLQSAVGLAQLSALEDRIGRQVRIYELYREHLTGLEGITLPGFDTDNGSVPLWTDALTEHRDELDSYLSGKGVNCRRFWFPLHTQEPYLQQDDSFPGAMSAAPHALWLPSAFTLTDDDVLTVCRYIKQFAESM